MTTLRSMSFIHDTDYVEVCGKRTILDLATTLGTLFGRYDNAFYSSSIKSKTFGRVIDLVPLREEIPCIQSVLEESEKSVGFLWQTALHLHESMLTVQSRMKFLKAQVKEQEELREKFKVVARGPTLPREIIDSILRHVPNNNKLIWEGETRVYVDGVVPLAVYHPLRLLPYYEENLNSEWTLGAIAEQKLRRAVLDDASLTNHIKLCTYWGTYISSDDVSDLRPLMNYPHFWKKLVIYPKKTDMDDFINWYHPCIPFLEELDIDGDYLSSSGIVAPLDSSRLRTARIPFRLFSDFFNTGCLKSITRLCLHWIKPGDFVGRNAFKEALFNFPRILSQLQCLAELEMLAIDCKSDDIDGLPRINSNLHSLNVEFEYHVFDVASIFLNLFADCHIDHIQIEARFLREAARLFSNARHICVENYFSEISIGRNQDGSLPFPRMDRLELSSCYQIRKSQEGIILQLQKCLLQVLRARSEDTIALQIGYLCIPRRLVTSAQFQEELEGHVCSLVLTD